MSHHQHIDNVSKSVDSQCIVSSYNSPPFQPEKDAEQESNPMQNIPVPDADEVHFVSSDEEGKSISRRSTNPDWDQDAVDALRGISKMTLVENMRNVESYIMRTGAGSSNYPAQELRLTPVLHQSEHHRFKPPISPLLLGQVLLPFHFPVPFGSVPSQVAYSLATT